jgi:hypothetical protein
MNASETRPKWLSRLNADRKYLYYLGFRMLIILAIVIVSSSLLGSIPGIVQMIRFDSCASDAIEIGKPTDQMRREILGCAKRFEIKDAKVEFKSLTGNDIEMLDIEITYSVELYVLFSPYQFGQDKIWSIPQ